MNRIFAEKEKEISSIFEIFQEIVADKLEVEKDRVTMNARFRKDLGADSLDEYELVYAVNFEMGVDIPDDRHNEIETVEDAVETIYELKHPEHAAVIKELIIKNIKNSWKIILWKFPWMKAECFEGVGGIKKKLDKKSGEEVCMVYNKEGAHLSSLVKKDGDVIMRVECEYNKNTLPVRIETEKVDSPEKFAFEFSYDEQCRLIKIVDEKEQTEEVFTYND